MPGMAALLLPALFFATALLYACVGFGGGSTYNALLVLAETDFRILPVIALLCNIIVVSGGVWHFHKAGHLDLRGTLPWILVSVPAAWLGGFVDISEFVFVGLLAAVLLLSGVRMLWPSPGQDGDSAAPSAGLEHTCAKPLIGGALGFVAGLTGIGGGIFLAPVLHLLRWADARIIAGTCSLFILVNSLSGLIGQTMKHASLSGMASVFDYWLVFPAVLIGGQIGSRLGAARIDAQTVRTLTAALILYVSARLFWRWAGMF